MIKMGAIIKRKNQKGFTLVELIVVMAILAILAALAVPRFTNMLSSAQSDADAANIKLLQNAVDLYYAQVGKYPTGLGDLTSTKTTDSGTTYGPWIKKVPEPNKEGTFSLNSNYEVIISTSTSST